MDLHWYLSTLRRRWLVIAATFVVAIIAAQFTTQTLAPLGESNAPPTYTASTLLASDGQPIGDLPGTTRALATYATTAQVAERAAEELGFKGNPLKLADRIEAAPDLETPFVTITGSGTKPEKVERIADAFAVALTDFLGDHKDRFYRPLIAALDRSIRAAERQGDEASLASYRSQRAILQTELTSPVAVTIVQRAVAEQTESTDFRPPDSGLVRLAIAAVIGLLAGAALVLVLERVDTRIRTSEQATEKFGYPVLAEIPSIRRDQRKGVVTTDHPTSPSADAFRLLGAGVHVGIRSDPTDGPTDGGRIVLLTSAGPAEGKSTVAVNLAAVLAEEGKKVIVVSADLRRPTLHDTLGADPRPGLIQATRDRDPGLNRIKQSTRLHRVSFVPSGGHAERPGEVLGSSTMVELLQQARTEADWVLVDTAPILLAGESAPLLAHADVVLVIARSGSISTPVAERTRDVLHRLGVDAAWVVLNDCKEKDVPAAYRRYHVMTEREANGDVSGVTAKTKGFPP